MRVIDTVRRAGRNLGQAKVRTFLTSMAIGVGAFTIALAMAAGNGGRAYLDDMVGALGSMQNINVSAQQDAPEETDNKPKKVGEEDASRQSMFSFKQLSAKDVEKLEKLKGVEAVLPMFSPEIESASANGSDEYQATVQAQADDSEIEIEVGKLGENYEIPQGGIVLPYEYVEPFNFKSSKEALGKNVQLTFATPDGSKATKELRIVAVDKEPKSPLAFYSGQFRISNKDGKEISAMQQPEGASESFFGVMVRAEKGANVDEVKQRILEAGDYDAQTFADMRTSVMQVVNIVQYGLMGFGALAILASIFGIINTQYISVLERTSQIGLMKALGMRRRDVSRLFRYEAAWIGFLGGVIGVGAAYLVTLLNPVIANLLSLDEGTKLLQMDWIMSGVLVLGLVVVAIVSGWFPSRKAAKLDPIEALRTE